MRNKLDKSLMIEYSYFIGNRVGANLVAECDIHAVTGVLKLYFRELPEPVFTEALYQRFVDTLGKLLMIVLLISFDFK